MGAGGGSTLTLRGIFIVTAAEQHAATFPPITAPLWPTLFPAAVDAAVTPHSTAVVPGVHKTQTSICA